MVDVTLMLAVLQLALLTSVANLVAIVVGLGAVVEFCTAGVVNFGITTRPWRRRQD